MIVDVCFVSLKRMIVQRCVKVLYCFLELFILVERKTAFVENFGVSWFSGESIAEVIDGLGVLLNIDVNVAPLHQEILVSWLPLQSLVQIVQSFLIVFHQTVGFSDSFENTCVFRAQLLCVEEIFNRVLVASFSEFT